jgi:hypothetical protein
MRSGAVAILFGAAVGVVAGFMRRSSEPPAMSRPSAGSGAATSGARTTPSASETSRAATPSAADTTPTAAPSSAPPTGATLATATASASAPRAESPFPLAVPLPPVTSASELARAEVRCYEVDPEECGRAADGYDEGRLVPRDAPRAERLRKVELTRLVRRCEERSPHACLVLAGRYESGQGVTENDRHARALVEHARELCRRGAKSECVDGEPK